MCARISGSSTLKFADRSEWNEREREQAKMFPVINLSRATPPGQMGK